MLELRPTCEHCNKPLPPDATDAMICSFECTFCESCVDAVLKNVCPNCGGGFSRRPIRPALDHRGGNFLGAYPASEKVIFKPVDIVAHARFTDAIKGIPPHRR